MKTQHHVIDTILGEDTNIRVFCCYTPGREDSFGNAPENYDPGCDAELILEAVHFPYTTANILPFLGEADLAKLHADILAGLEQGDD